MDFSSHIRNHVTESPITVQEWMTAHDARKLMKERKIHHLPVVNEGTVLGLISSRDLDLVTMMPDASGVTVGDLMSTPAVTVPFDLPVKAVVEKMVADHVGSVVVLDAKCEVMGIFTSFDAMKLLTTVL